MTSAPVPLAEQPTEGEFQIAERLVNHQWGVSVRQIADALRDHRLATLQQHERASSERDNLQRTFDLQWEADQRAIKRWQEAHPGNGMVWPDRANMVVWLMDQLDAAIATFDDEEAGHQDTLRLWLEAKAKHERAMAALREVANSHQSSFSPFFLLDPDLFKEIVAMLAALDAAANTAGDAVTTEEER